MNTFANALKHTLNNALVNRSIKLALAISILAPGADALDLASLTNHDAAAGVKAALNQGAVAAVAKLGVENGFLNNEKVKVRLPGALKQGEKLLRSMGMGKQADELVVAMNHAAESAVVEAKPLLVNAIKSMSLTDAKNILAGGDDSVTRFFREKTSQPLSLKFLPIVKKSTDRVGFAQNTTCTRVRRSVWAS